MQGVSWYDGKQQQLVSKFVFLEYFFLGCHHVSWPLLLMDFLLHFFFYIAVFWQSRVKHANQHNHYAIKVFEQTLTDVITSQVCH